MKDAFGGIFNFVLIIVFLTIIEGVLGFLVVYTKAFKMKNIVISVIEEYASYGCGVRNGGTLDYSDNYTCIQKMKDRAQEIAYSANSSLDCSKYGNEFVAHRTGFFCFKEKIGSEDKQLHKFRKVYTIVTEIRLELPIINNMHFSFFSVGGDTREIQVYS